VAAQDGDICSKAWFDRHRANEKVFGRRWAYRLQKRIIGECLEGVVFTSRKAADQNLTQGFPAFLERVRKKEIQEAVAILETLAVHPPNNYQSGLIPTRVMLVLPHDC
jgi:hypothetical protein